MVSNANSIDLRLTYNTSKIIINSMERRKDTGTYKKLDFQEIKFDVERLRINYN